VVHAIQEEDRTFNTVKQQQPVSIARTTQSHTHTDTERQTGSDLMCVGVSTVNQLLVAIIQHPQLRLVRALIQQRAEKAEVGHNLASLGLREVVRQLQAAHLSVVRQSVSTARQHSDL